MRISFTPSNFSFKSNAIPKLPEGGIVMGYDDPISSKRREIIREHLEEKTGLVYQQYYGLPKSDYEMNQMLKSWGLKIDNITKEIIIPDDLNFIALGNNNFRGPLSNAYLIYKKLKESGITTVIYADYNISKQEEVNNAGINSINLYAQNYVNGGKEDIFSDFAFIEEEYYIRGRAETYEYYSKYEKEFSSKEFVDKKLEKDRDIFRTKSREFIDELIKAVRAWQNGGCIIGCMFGCDLTDYALIVIDAFNPKGDSRVLCKKLSPFRKKCIGTLYKKLTEQDKNAMGWTKEFESSFLKCFGHI